MKSKKKILKDIAIVLITTVCFILFVFIGTNVYVRMSVKKRIMTHEEACGSGDYDCIIVMGASVYADDTPSPMLADRINEGIALYKDGASDTLIMSGDKTDEEYYDEVSVMKDYAVEQGVPEECILRDPAGYSTYETMYRVAKLYEGKRVLIVTQQYHLTRAVYDAVKLGMDAYGVPCAKIKYRGQLRRDVREWLAISKDFFYTIARPAPDTLDRKITP